MTDRVGAEVQTMADQESVSMEDCERALAAARTHMERFLLACAVVIVAYIEFARDQAPGDGQPPAT